MTKIPPSTDEPTGTPPDRAGASAGIAGRGYGLRVLEKSTLKSLKSRLTIQEHMI